MPAVQLPRGLLRTVAKPARYVGGEWNSISKPLPINSRELVRFAFCFPDTYEIGMSNLALRIFYSLLNERSDTWCERVFAPWTDMAGKMRAAGLPLFSIESRTPLSEFDIVGFTLQVELSYTNVLNMLDLGGVPLRSADRGDGHPLVIAGGPAVFNIEPMADFFDLVMIGEGEELIGEFLDLYRGWKEHGREDKTAFLLKAAQIPGVYVPSFYDVSTGENGAVYAIKPNRPGVPPVVRKRIIGDLDRARWPVRDIVPSTEIVHDRTFLELFRGCPRGCRFCQAGMIYRPVREKTARSLIDQARLTEADSGCDEVGLLSLSTSDYSDLPHLSDQLLGHFEPRRTSLSLPSLRLDSFTLPLMEKAARTRKSGLTFAPEAGTQRLRDVINKDITADDLLKAMRLAFEGGWSGAKLYFMLGLPTETPEDVDGIAQLVRSIISLYRELPRERRLRKLELTVSTSMFIPKPFTPFQWAGQPSLDTLRDRQRHLRELLKLPGVKYQWHDLPTSRLEAVLARGDRRVSAAIIRAWEKGCSFDAWDETFNWTAWEDSFHETGIDPNFYASRERPENEVFPWSHIDCGVTRGFLYSEWQKALAGETTPECRLACGACGAGDFSAGLCAGQTAAASGADQPDEAKKPELEHASQTPSESMAEQPKIAVRLRFSRQEPAIWLAHLDMMRVFERAVRRAGLPVAYSQGFNPRPQMVFALPIGTGLATLDDIVDLDLTREVPPGDVMAALNHSLPPGLSILQAEPAPESGDSVMSLVTEAEYLLDGKGLAAAAERAAAMPAGEPWTVDKTGKSGTTRLDIRPLVLDMKSESPERLVIRVRAGSRQNLRPDLFLAALVQYGGLDPSIAAGAAITRLRLLISPLCEQPPGKLTTPGESTSLPSQPSHDHEN